MAIITTRTAAGEPVGLTCNSFSSVSLEPPLVLFSLRKASRLVDVFATAPGFAINILSQRQDALSARFAGETLVIPTGHEKTRANDTTFRFRPSAARVCVSP